MPLPSAAAATVTSVAAANSSAAPRRSHRFTMSISSDKYMRGSGAL